MNANGSKFWMQSFPRLTLNQTSLPKEVTCCLRTVTDDEDSGEDGANLGFLLNNTPPNASASAISKSSSSCCKNSCLDLFPFLTNESLYLLFPVDVKNYNEGSIAPYMHNSDSYFGAKRREGVCG